MNTSSCAITEHCISSSVAAVTLENTLLSLTLLPEKGADIYSLVYKPKGIDILWKSPLGPRPPGKGIQTSFDSEGLWMENYPGGWQFIFPNGGDACAYKGAELGFHGEASMTGWDVTVLEDTPSVSRVAFSTRLRKLPFRISRCFSLQSGEPSFSILETITNEGGVPLDCMWGEHPAFGKPFLSDACRIRTGARKFIADESCSLASCPVMPGKTSSWPVAAGKEDDVDLARIPSSLEQRYMMGYLTEFDHGWYEIENMDLQLIFGLEWDKLLFPYAWFWQEINAGQEYPWFGNAYVAAIEPFSSYPGYGLGRVIGETGTQIRFNPGETKETTLSGYFRSTV